MTVRIVAENITAAKIKIKETYMDHIGKIYSK